MSRTIVNQEKEVECSCQTNSFVYDDLIQAIERRDVHAISDMLNCCDLATVEQGGAKIQAHGAFRDINGKLKLQPLIIKTLKLLLDRGVDVNAKDSKERTVLHLAVEGRMTEVIDFLLDRQADLHVRDSKGNSLLHFLIGVEIRKCSEWNPTLNRPGSLEPRQRRSTEFIRWMILKGLNVDRQNSDGDTAVHLAASYNLLHALSVLLEHAKDVQICNNDKKNAFLIFVESIIGKKVNRDRTTSRFIQNDDDVVVYGILTSNYHPAFIDKIFIRFLSKGFSINFIDNCGNTPVHYALKLDRPKIVKAILKNFTALNARDENGNTALHIVIEYLCKDKCYSLQHEYDEIARVLLARGASINVANRHGFTPLHIVMKSKKVALQKKFIEYAISYDQRYKDNLLLYFLKTKIEKNMTSDQAVFDLLISQGWDVNAKDAQGMTLLHVAAQLNRRDRTTILELNFSPESRENREDAVETLIGRGAKVDITNNNGLLPLHIAIVHKNSEVIMKLLKFGADINDITPVSNIGAIKDGLFDFRNFPDPLSTMPGLHLFLAHEPISYIIKRHLIKLQVAKLPINDELKFLLEPERSKLTLHQVCSVEIESLKTYKIADGTSLYDLLHFNRNSTCAYVKNEKLKQLITSLIFEKQFPMYHALISAAYYAGVERRKMLEPAKDALNELANIRLPEVCFYEIFRYLNNVSLRSMIEGGKNRL